MLNAHAYDVGVGLVPNAIEFLIVRPALYADILPTKPPVIPCPESLLPLA